MQERRPKREIWTNYRHILDHSRGTRILFTSYGCEYSRADFYLNNRTKQHKMSEVKKPAQPVLVQGRVPAAKIFWYNYFEVRKRVC